MNRLLGIVIGLVVAASLAPAAHVRADGSTVGGTLTGDTHWTLAGSPYVFSANVILATGATLTIDPGVTVLANAHALYLQGKVTAVGTPTDPIVMDHAVEIVFYPGAEGSAFAWTEFRSMFDYVRPDQNTYGPLPSLAHVWFNGGRGLYFYYPHAGTVTDTYTFSDARFTGGAEVGGCCSSWSGSRLSIEGGGVITAYSNSIGITISDSNILPKAGSCGSAAGLGCAIGTFTGTMPITATNNWWGTTDRAAIDAAIYDGLDQPGQPVVSVDPIRTGPLDLNGPTTQIDPAVDPAGGPLTGTAADNPLGATGVASVVASVRDTVTGDWWNGVAWAPSETFLPATGTTTWSLPLPTLVDGRQYAVRSHATDVAGNHQWGTTQASVWADGTPPSGSVEILSQQGSGQWSSDPNVVVYQHVTNPGAGGVVAFRYSLDGVTWRQASSWVDDFAVDLHDASIGGSNSEGPRSVWVEWQDSHGLWSAPASDSIILDTTPPDGSATVNSGVASTSSVVVPVRVDATDATTWVAGAWLSNDGTHWVNVPIGNDIAWDLSANGGTGAVGAHTVWWKVADGPGNESPSAGISLALDANVPLVSTPSVPAMVVPQTAGHASASLHSAWAGAATAGISGYDVERSVAGPGRSWRTRRPRRSRKPRPSAARSGFEFGRSTPTATCRLGSIPQA